jgi:predicted 3-demethylubiquinone-9 3-methyltransferase (glyoxalase superfamily)
MGNTHLETAMSAPSFATCLWFDHGAEEAARTYVALFEDAEILQVYPQRGDPEGRAFMVRWRLGQQVYSGLNGGPHYSLTPAASIEVHLETQDEVDRIWDALLEGGTAQRCGWLTDRFGVSWQIIPRTLMRLMQTENAARAQRVTQAMMAMVKLDGPALERAAEGG